jgi:rfaE bifunctional protein nucleotidyltransferase chain/domain
LKEGSILDQDEQAISIGPILMLSIEKHDWKEDKKVIHDVEQLRLLKKQLDKSSKKIVLTSGCFDILHVGHLNTLKKAKSLGDILIVCLSSDEQIRALKGKSRPINKFDDRLSLFKTIECVDYIFPYQEEFIQTEESLGSIMKILDPDIWVKGSDYTIHGIKEKHPYLRNIELLPFVDEKSTTRIIKKIEENFKR